MKRNYKFCINQDKDWCILWSACADCYYYKERDLVCPKCERNVPNNKHLVPGGCKWCQR